MELPNKNPFRDDMNAPLIDAIKDIMEGKINQENLNIGTHGFRTIAAAKKNAGVEEEAQVESYGNPFTPRVSGTFAAPNFRGGLKAGDKVRVPHKGKMVSGKIVRYDDGGTDKARQHGGGYIVDIGEPASILVPKQNVRKEEVEHIEEVRVDEASWGGGFQSSREAQAGVQAAMKADAKKRQMLIISALQQVIDGKMSKAAFKKLTGHSYDEMMTLPFYSKKVKMKKEEVENLDESATKAAIEDFMYDTLTKAAIAELKPIVKSKTSDRMKKIEAVLKKHKIPTTSPIGGKSAQLVADFFDSFHGESVDEAYARPNEKPIGAFTLAGATKFSNSAQGRFEYRISEDSWGKSHGLPHEVCVSSKDPTGKQNWRAANVKGTVCIIALDEDAEGKPVLEKWAIRHHVKYVKAEETDQEGEVIKEQDRAAMQGSKSSFKEAI